MKKKIKIEKWANYQPGYIDPLEYAKLYETKNEAKAKANFDNWIQVKLTGEVEIEVPEPTTVVSPSMLDQIYKQWPGCREGDFVEHIKRKLFGDSHG